MKSKENSALKTLPNRSRYSNLAVIVLNVILIVSVFLLYMAYNDAYDDRLREENLGNIANLNRSSATNAMSLFESWHIKLNDIAQYVQMQGLTYDETLKIISETNSCDDRYFELIRSDYTGYLARENADGTYTALDYSSSSYAELQKAFDNVGDGTLNEICFAPEYTDGGDSAAKFFAIYKHISLKAPDGHQETCTLLLATKSRAVLEVLNSQSDYKGQSTVLVDSSGNYIVGNQDFKSSNFFRYLYVSNDLNLDQQKAIQQEMRQKGKGALYYKNSGVVVEDCVFLYERMGLRGWYCITCVPLSSFHSPAFNINYIIYAVALLLALFVIDLVWLQGMNRRLKISMLREKEASAAKGNFMSRMSHEIRTPLNAVIGYNTLARNEMAEVTSGAEGNPVDRKVMDCLVKSDLASKHLLTIINDVLDMSAIESGRIKVVHEEFDFKGLISSLTTIFYSQARTKGVEFEVIFDTMTEEWFVGDQMRTNQILTNLLSNAVKFTPEGGHVKLIIRQPEADTNASHINFEVIDTGIGMTEEYLNHIWTPFEQADSSISRRFGGTGLGLSITKNLVDLMGGSITVESTPEVGSKFSVDLTFERAEQTHSTEVYDFNSVKALVVDDDVNTCDYIRLLFNRCGAKCVAVTSGIEAVDAVTVAIDAGEPYNMCLVDWRMPDMDGIETIKHIRALSGSKIPIIVLTAYDYSELADKAVQVGVNKFISKPLFQSSLFDLLASTNGKQMQTVIRRDRKFDFGGARVLLAEDNDMNMEIAKKILESAGLVVDSAKNGREAVEIFSAAPAGAYGAILMDVHMPEMNGHEATRTIRVSSHPEAKSIPIIAMTADAFAENVAEALAAGMNDHIAKPIDIPTLLGTLRKYMS